MLSKAKIKFINSLHTKKYRKIHNQFIVEGEKNLLELFQSDFQLDEVFVTEEFVTRNESQIEGVKYDIVEEKELVKAGTFSSNSAGLAVVNQQANEPLNIETDDELVVVLDEINIPGNLGTIIRIADWYGIQKIVCSNTTADLYNPKTIAATMGSFTRVSLFYTDLKTYLADVEHPVVGAVLGGEVLYSYKRTQPNYLLIGSESNGISEELLPLISNPLMIPRIGGAESLNAGIATAIFCDNLVRGKL